MSRNRLSFSAVLAVLVVCSGIRSSAPAAIFADWTSASGTTATGTLDGTTVTAAFTVTGVGTQIEDLSDADFFDPPGSATQETVRYSVGSAITWTFSSPMSNVLLYVPYWRGLDSQGPTNNTYVFDASPTILSGLSDSSIFGSSLIVGDDFTGNIGILQFAGPLTSLTLSAPTGAGVSQQLFTLAVVPEPSTYAMALAGLACGGYLMKRRRKRS